MAGFTDFWKSLYSKLMGGKTYEVSEKDVRDFIDRNEWNRLAIYDFALHVGINIIAYALSKCEFKTFMNGKEVRQGEYYLWNYQPNRNMNTSQFLQTRVWSLIYRGECLVVQSTKGDLLIADEYTHETYALSQDTFSNVTVGLESDGGCAHPYTFRRTFKMDDVLFYRLNNKNVTNLLNQLMNEYDGLLESAINKFYKSGGERGVLTVSGKAPQINYGTNEDGTPRTFNQVYNEMMGKQFANYFRSPNAVMTLWDGFTYETKGGEANKKSTSEIKDVTDLTDEIYSKVANAMLLPPGLLKGDVSGTSDITKNMITFAIDPIAKMIERENNRKRSGEAVLKGTYQKIDTSAIQHIDAFDIAQSADKMLASGIWSIDEIRRKAGDTELGTEWSEKHWMTKNYADIKGAGTDPAEEGGLNE